MLTQVSDQLVKQFADRFGARVAAPDVGQGGDSGGETAAETVEQPKELNGLAFAWKVLVGLIKDLFGGRSKQAN